MKHQGTKAIETRRLLLRPFCREDGPLIYKNWASDPEVTKYLRWPPHASPGVTEEILGAWLAGYEDPSFYQWAIVPRELGEPIGSIGAVGQNPAADTVHIGYCIGRPWWNRGFTSEALETLISFFFEEVEAGRVETQHDPDNPASGAVMRKCGMTLEGVLRRADRSNRGIVDACLYRILREEYGRDIWARLYEGARGLYHPRELSPFVYADHVVCALESGDGRIYTGVCLESCSGVLNLCAERSAALNMYLNSGQTRVRRLLAFRDSPPNGGGSGLPCGACREFFLQLDRANGDMEILTDYEKRETVTLKELLPQWWGEERWAQGK